MPPKAKAPGFMDIPTEIRWQIYGYLLRPTGHVIIEEMPLKRLYWKNIPDRSVYPYRQPSFYIKSPPAMTTYRGILRHRLGSTNELQIHTNIMQLNKQILKETIDSLYGQCIWFDCSIDGMQAFLNDRSNEALSSIVDMTLAVPAEMYKFQFRALCASIAERIRLRRLNVRINSYLWKERESGETAITEGYLLEFDWVQSLLPIKGLDSLNVKFNHRYFEAGRTFEAELTKFLRSRMLKKEAAEKFSRRELEMESYVRSSQLDL
ncbi:MAG: hypothetical protein Q9186_004329 [Xanthomendoza sp. 1 TL-2023]